MKCIACGRRLEKYTVSIPSKDGLIGWGPVCARAVTIRPARTPAPARRPRAPQPVDPAQRELELETT